MAARARGGRASRRRDEGSWTRGTTLDADHTATGRRGARAAQQAAVADVVAQCKAEAEGATGPEVDQARAVVAQARRKPKMLCFNFGYCKRRMNFELYV